MSLQSVKELENTHAKLRMLEELYEDTRQRPTANERVRDMSLKSIGQRIKRLKEEIARFECQQAFRR